jgi:hypothetical protein
MRLGALACTLLAVVVLTPGSATGQETGPLPPVEVSPGDSLRSSLLPSRLSSLPLLEESSPIPRIPWNRGSFRLAAGQVVVGNLINWALDEYVMDYKDIARTSPASWWLNLKSGPEWDDNHFSVNMLMHPTGGHFYYLAGRTNGYKFEQSFWWTLAGSLMWECCGESHHMSGSDFVTTTLGGVAMGEMLYRLNVKMLSRGKWWNRVARVTNPTLWMTDAVMRRSWHLDEGVPWELPQSFRGSLLGGYQLQRSGLETYHSSAFEIQTTYEDLQQIDKGARPFAHFEMAVELNPGSEPVMNRIQGRGTLWPLWVWRAPTTALGLKPSSVHVLPYLDWDYVNRLKDSLNSKIGHQFGGSGLGISMTGTWGDPARTTLSLTGDGQLFFGGINSEFARLGQIRHGQEREREYDIGAGPGFGGSAVLGITSKVRLSGFYRQNRFYTLHGSNIVDPSDPDHRFHSRHRVAHFGTVFTWSNIIGRLGLGADIKFNRSRSVYDDPMMQLRQLPRPNDNRLRIYAMWDFSGRPRGLFAF